MTKPELAPPVLAAIAGRRSVRAFLERAVAPGLVEEILATAARAPSGNNSQPWRVHVLTGPAKVRLSAGILAERATRAPEPAFQYPYYPVVWPEAYLSRRVRAAVQPPMTLAEPGMPSIRSWWLPVPRVQAAHPGWGPDRTLCPKDDASGSIASRMVRRSAAAGARRWRPTESPASPPV